MAKKPPSFIKPENGLKKKVGDGGIPAYLIKRCQEFLESNPVDLTPYANRNLEQLILLREKIGYGGADYEDTMKEIVDIIMQLKSNGSMFHYQLISMISDVMLRFLENIKKLDSDFLDIFGVYNKVLGIILNKRLTGNGGREGYALTQELHNACLRYYTKHGISH